MTAEKKNSTHSNTKKHKPDTQPTREERDRRALLASAPRAADAVRVGLDRVRHVVVDHQGDVGDVDAAPGDVGGDEHVELVRLEALDRRLALVLAAPAVQRRAAVAQALARGVDLVDLALGVGEDDDLLLARELQLGRQA